MANRDDAGPGRSPAGRKLRMAINLANGAVARIKPDGILGGPAIEMALFLARRLDAEPVWVTYASAGRIVDSIDLDEWDLAFLAIDEQRREKLDFTPPYASASITAIVPLASPLLDCTDIDRPSVRIGSARGAAYDNGLQGLIRNASLCRHDTPAAALSALARGHLDAAVGVKESLEAFTRTNASFRLLTGTLMAVEHAVAVRKQVTVKRDLLTSLVAERMRTPFPS